MVIIGLTFIYSDLGAPNLQLHIASLLALTHRKWHNFLHLHVEILFTNIGHLHTDIFKWLLDSFQTLHFMSELPSYFNAKRLPLLSILKCKQWLIHRTEINEATETTEKQPIKFT